MHTTAAEWSHGKEEPGVQPISIAQMIEVDRLMVDEYGIELQQMMENAGRSLAGLARHLLGGSAAGRKVAVMGHASTPAAANTSTKTWEYDRWIE